MRPAPPSDLAKRVADRIAAWRIVADRQVETDHSVLVFGQSDNRPVVLKVVKQRGNEWLTGRVLAVFEGRGAVRVYDAVEGAVLLERARPGTPLTAMVARGADEEATRVLARTIRLMTSPPERATPAHVPTALDWGRGFDRFTAGGHHLLPDALVSAAARIYSDLCRSQTRTLLLHGDLHHDNVLFDDDRGWLAVDPKGVTGEVEYETGATLRNPHDQPAVFSDPSVISRRIRIFAEELSADPHRIVAWAFAQAVLAVIWANEDGEPIAADHPWIELAETLQSMLTD
jgi:streptomycin 6-kinase